MLESGEDREMENCEIDYLAVNLAEPSNSREREILAGQRQCREREIDGKEEDE